MPTVLVNEKKIPITDGGILLNELEKHDINLPSGCLAGSCGVCKVEIHTGAKNLSAPGAVELDTLLHFQDNNKTYRLACRAKVLGDITISY
jgi:ferredoxin